MSIIHYQEISRRLSIGQPLLMIDRAMIDVEAKSATAIKAVSMNEHLFQGHFPKEPILPGVMHIMGAVQTASLLLQKMITPLDDTTIILKEIIRYKFRNPVVPGDVIRYEVNVTEELEDGIWVAAKIFCGETVVSEGRLQIGYTLKSAFYQHHNLDVPSCPSGDFLNIKAIMHHIPHRFPFLLIDRIYEINSENQTIIGAKNISGNDVYMLGLQEYAMPNAMLVEAAAQAACAYALAQPAMANKIGLFFAIDHAKFYDLALPGDQVIFNLSAKSGRISFSGGTLLIGDKVIGEVEMKFVLVESI